MLVSAGLAAAYGPKGVRVNAVNPGLTLTERLKEGMAAEAKLANISIDDAIARANQRLPLGRIAKPEEIADAVLFLASPRASYITGAILAMDGAVTPMVV
jgi:NAD(P)-dependent dehydrogenase (short-subunit alcohol dehydrogenase family)